MTTLSLTKTVSSWPADVSSDTLGVSSASIRAALMAFDTPLYFAQTQQGLGVTRQLAQDVGEAVQAFVPALPISALGDPAFLAHHQVKYAYHAGAMANAIASVEMVIALGKVGILASFGAAGLVPDVIEQSIAKIQAALPDGPFAVNLIHSPQEPALEKGGVERLLKMGVNTVEASAYLDLTEHIVHYRAAGLSEDVNGNIIIGNKVIGKVSRIEVGRRFMEPAAEKFLQKLLADGRITDKQAELARRVPMADDITAEADSGGHTDNRPLVTLFPSILQLRDEIQAERQYPVPIRVGVGGGIGTPESALAAFTMGAAYIVTGSINQACVEAGASEHTRKLLAEADMADVIMAPAADMFEMGVKLQVLKRGTMFAMRAQKLYDLYMQYESIDAIPTAEREKVEKQIFRQSLENVWQATQAFFEARDPDMLKRAQTNPKRKMALIFRWYLGLSSRWSNIGESGREMDYQIWAGPSLGAFNRWVKSTYLNDYKKRHVADVALQLLTGTAYLQRINMLKVQGVQVDDQLRQYLPG